MSAVAAALEMVSVSLPVDVKFYTKDEFYSSAALEMVVSRCLFFRCVLDLTPLMADLAGRWGGGDEKGREDGRAAPGLTS